MSDLSRRRFLKGAAAVTAGAGLGLLPNRASHAWGQLPPGLGIPKYKILDIVLPGGASQWESFWVSHDGPGGSLNWRGLEDFVMDLSWASGGNHPSPGETHTFLNGPTGDPALSWGPALKPLWLRHDILDRTRMVLTKHSLEVHSLGLFLNQTGRDFGAPRAAGLGAPIQRHFQSLPDPSNTPYSYVLAPSHLGREYVVTNATTVGQHPGSSRPLALRVGESIGGLLDRNGVSSASDAVTDALRNEYRDLLRFQGNGAPVGSPAFDSYEGAAHYLNHASELNPLFGGTSMLAPDVIPACSDSTGSTTPVSNTTRRSLELAAEMFDAGARYITVVDGGIDHGGLRDSGFPYDGHHRNGRLNVVEMTSAHLFNLCQSLAAVIHEPGQSIGLGSGQGATSTINLNDTLIRIFTEFGRDPSPNTGGDEDYASCGREHFPAANFQIMIGGPVAHRGLQGWVGFEDQNPLSAVPHEALTPTDVYAAMLMAAGVDPFSSENLTTGDHFSEVVLADGPGTNSIRTNLLERVFGHSSWI